MKRVWGRVLGGVTVLGVGVIVFAACKHDDSTLFVQSVLASPFVTAGQACTFTSDPTQPAISSGSLDTSLRNNYMAEFLIGNQAVPEANPQQLATETNIITIQGAIVTVTDSAGNQLNYVTVPTSATVYPSSGGTPGYAPISATIIDQTTLAATGSLAAAAGAGGSFTLLTYTKFFGYTLGGSYVESDNFEFPVSVCSGCLIAFTNNAAFPTPNCAGATASSTGSSQPLPCTIGQDFVVPCAACASAGFAACNGTSTGTTTDAGTVTDAGGAG